MQAPKPLILDDMGRTVDASGHVLQMPSRVPTLKVRSRIRHKSAWRWVWFRWLQTSTHFLTCLRSLQPITFSYEDVKFRFCRFFILSVSFKHFGHICHHFQGSDVAIGNGPR